VTVRTSSAQWNGDLKSGNGEFTVGTDVYTGAYTFASRFEEGPESNPEELAGAAIASCFSMFLANVLASDGATVDSVRTEAAVHLGRVDGAPQITDIELTTRVAVSDVDDATFQEKVEASKAGCPISKLFAGANITVDATRV
jgi:lipoyl-dependent peroxiredoxin